MVKEIKDEFKKYLEETERALEEKNKNAESIRKNYAGARLSEKLADNEKAYANSVQYSIKAHKSIVDATLRIARQAIYKKIVVDLPLEVSAMLDSMRAMGEVGALTETQIDAYIDKYRSVYPAFNAILATAHKYGLSNDKVCISPEALENDLKYIEELATGVFSKRLDLGEGLYIGIACEDPHIDLIDIKLESFMDGYFDDPTAKAPEVEDKTSVKEVETTGKWQGDKANIKVAGNFEAAGIE